MYASTKLMPSLWSYGSTLVRKVNKTKGCYDFKLKDPALWYFSFKSWL